MDNHILFILSILLILSSVEGASAKTGSTFYTPERVANARRNIERCDWAKRIRNKAVERADELVGLSDDVLWELVTPQDIPRGIEVNREHGCPKCGKAIERFGNYPWKCDAINKPWKIECPSCGEAFPKNDFGKFYESGKDEQGVFRLDRADRSLLFNTNHPDPNDPLHNYAVDDSLGWKDADGQVYRFIGYYGHYGSWTAALATMKTLCDAYVYTGDARYARKAALMLFRVAEFYPQMDYSRWAKLGFFNSDGGTGKGKVYGRIWETGTATSLLSVYDGVYPALRDSELLKYLSSKTGKSISAADARALIEKNVVREVHDGVLKGDIVGNEGMHQYAMALAAVVLDEPGTSREWLDWIFAPGDARAGNPTGGGVLGIFENKIDEDGMGDEASPGYNAIWRGKFRAISELLEIYPSYEGPKIVDLPKYRSMFEAPVRIICLGSYIPHIGDTARTGDPGTGGIQPEELAYAYRTFRDPLHAQMAHFLNGGKADGIHLGLFDSDPEGVAKEIEAEVAEHGPYVPKTEEMPSYGLTVLRSGSGANQRALTLYYGRNTGHGHKDTLNTELFGFGLDLMPDMGYPELATVWPPRYEWHSNTICHNTVVVDRMKQRDQRLGKARFVKQGDGASAAEVYAGKPYPQTSLYQRTVAMVDVSEEDFYIVDVFRVTGGKGHHYSLHGPEGDIQTEGLSLVAQPKGTLAGEDIQLAADIGGRENAWRDASGFQYLYDIRRDAKPSDQPSVTWKVKDTWSVLKQPRDIRLRVNLISPPDEVILAHGDPPQNKPGNPRRLEYIILPHESDSSTFVTVIEPYEGERSIRKIERTDDGDTVTLKITLESGRVDYVLSAVETGRIKVGGKEISGMFAIVSEEAGKAGVRLLE